MEILTYLVQKLHIDLIIVVLVFAAGFFQAKYLTALKWSAALKTLIVSFLFSMIYIVLLYISGAFQKEQAAIYFISYCVATSFYEILIKPFSKSLKGEVKKIAEGAQA